MVFHGFWLVSMVFKVVSWFFRFLVGFHGFQGGFMVFGWFPSFFKVVSWFFMVFGWWPPIDVTQKGAGRRSNVKQSLSEKAASHLPTGPHQHRRRRTDLILGNAF